MTLWWIGNGVLLFVVIPAVVLVLIRVMRPALSMRRCVDELAEQREGITPELEELSDLERTPDLARAVSVGLHRYAAAVGKLAARGER